MELEELILESDCYRDSMQDYIACICFEINKLKANYPEENLDNLISNITLLVKHCDAVLIDNEEKSYKLDSSLRETVDLAFKLEKEKKQKDEDLNRSLFIKEAEYNKSLTLSKQIKELEAKLARSNGEHKQLILEINTLKNELKETNICNELLKNKNSIKRDTIKSLRGNLDILKSDFLALEAKQSWGRNKWVEDNILTDYFTAMSETISSSDVLFLGPSVTLAIRFSTPETALECLDLTSYNKSKYIFLCVSDCNDATEDDKGTHWSLLFLIKDTNMAYHIDSMQPMNEVSAKLIAMNLGIVKENVIEMSCIQQQKSFECGIHVLANTIYIAHHYCSTINTNNKVSFNDWFLGSTNKNSIPIDNGKQEKSNKSRKSQKAARPRITPYRHLTSWQTVPTKVKSVKVIEKSNINIKTKNSFEVLSNISDEDPFESSNNKSSQPGTNEGYKYIFTPHKYTSPTAIRSENNKSKPMIIIACDSQGRDLSTHLSHSTDRYIVFNNCHPGAPIQRVIGSVTNSSRFYTLSKQDYVIIIGGTNNMSEYQIKNRHCFLQEFLRFIEDQLVLFKHTNIIFATIPYRYDLSCTNPINELIKDTNIMIRKLVFDHSHAQLLDLYLLQSCYHTKHGLHINRKGKKCIAREIVKIAENHIKATHMTPISDVQEHHTAADRDRRSTSCISATVSNQTNNSTNQVQVIEADMFDIIDQFRDDPNIAFSHCISRDFSDQRHMSAGVAVIFKRKFGRPTRSDCLSEHLTIQHHKDQSAVYGLVTKSLYSSKPTIEDYNNAFNDLVDDFKKRCFRRLICSPMGCMRDQISPELFVDNIMHFQKEANVPVDIIVGNERASRTLRNGLKHEEFVKLLRRCIAERRLSPTSPSSAELPSSLRPSRQHKETVQGAVNDSLSNSEVQSVSQSQMCSNMLPICSNFRGSHLNSPLAAGKSKT